MYPEFMIAPMREELTRFGVRELRTAGEVDDALTQMSGTVMVVVNSVCGCAAGKARPGVALALEHAVRPDLRHDGVRRGRHGGNRASPGLLHRIPALVTVDRTVQGRQAGLHD